MEGRNLGRQGRVCFARIPESVPKSPRSFLRYSRRETWHKSAGGLGTAKSWRVEVRSLLSGVVARSGRDLGHGTEKANCHVLIQNVQLFHVFRTVSIDSLQRMVRCSAP